MEKIILNKSNFEHLRLYKEAFFSSNSAQLFEDIALENIIVN